MTQEDLERLLAKWQRILRLQDWDVHLRVVRRWEMHNEDTMGECEYLLRKRCAVIRILDSADYDPGTPWPQDQERTLVHELLHLAFAPFSRTEAGSAEAVAEEQVIHALASALVALRRGQEA